MQKAHGGSRALYNWGKKTELSVAATEWGRGEKDIKGDSDLGDDGKEYGFHFKISGKLGEGFKQRSGMIWFSFYIQGHKAGEWEMKPEIRYILP